MKKKSPVTRQKVSVDRIFWNYIDKYNYFGIILNERTLKKRATNKVLPHKVSATVTSISTYLTIATLLCGVSVRHLTI